MSQLSYGDPRRCVRHGISLHVRAAGLTTRFRMKPRPPSAPCTARPYVLGRANSASMRRPAGVKSRLSLHVLFVCLLCPRGELPAATLPFALFEEPLRVRCMLGSDRVRRCNLLGGLSCGGLATDLVRALLRSRLCPQRLGSGSQVFWGFEARDVSFLLLAAVTLFGALPLAGNCS